MKKLPLLLILALTLLLGCCMFLLQEAKRANTEMKRRLALAETAEQRIRTQKTIYESSREIAQREAHATDNLAPTRSERVADLIREARARGEAIKQIRDAHGEKTRKAHRGVQKTYGNILASLRLSESERKAIRAYLSEKKLVHSDLAELTKGAKTNREGREKVALELENESREEIRTAISAEAYEELGKILAAGKSLEQLQDGLFLDFAYNEIPLSPEQQLSLATIIETATSRRPADELRKLRLQPAHELPEISVLDSEILAAAGPLLSEAQKNLLFESLKSANQELIAVHRTQAAAQPAR